jgi:hypothetical protein
LKGNFSTLPALEPIVPKQKSSGPSSTQRKAPKSLKAASKATGKEIKNAVKKVRAKKARSAKPKTKARKVR